MRLGFGDAGNEPASSTTRRAYDLLAKGFGPGFNGPILIAAETPGGSGDLTVLNQLSADVNGTAGVAFATPAQPSAQGTAAIMQVSRPRHHRTRPPAIWSTRCASESCRTRSRARR